MIAPATTVASLVRSAREAERAGEWDDALQLFEAAFSRLPAEGDAATAADLLRWIGTIRRDRGELDLASELYEASVAVASANRLRSHEASGLNCIALALQLQGRLDAADTFYSRARELAGAIADVRLTAMVSQNQGVLANIRGDVPGALLHYRSSLSSFREMKNEVGCAWTLNNIGMALVDQARWLEAEQCFDEAFELAGRLGDVSTTATIELNRAELCLKRGDFPRARECCDRAFEGVRYLESVSGQAEAYRLYGILYRETSKPHLAERHLLQAIGMARDCNAPLIEAEAESERALVHLATGQNREALRSLNRAHELFQALQAAHEIRDLEQRLDGLEEIYLQVVRGWAESIEAKDRYTAGHCERVAEHACGLAEAVGIYGRDLTWFRMGAFLHDVGKTRIPSELLNKPGRLTPEEWALMRDHPVYGDRIVAELNFPWEIGPIVRSHHERWDGTGYPEGLKGEEIPLAARILCVADVYDAMTTTRSYRPGLPPEEALQIMEREAGSVLDPELFRTFRRLLHPEVHPGRLADGPALVAR